MGAIIESVVIALTVPKGHGCQIGDKLSLVVLNSHNDVFPAPGIRVTETG
jgi:hypothetical protein